MKTGLKSIDNLSEKYKAAIDDFSNETNNGDGYWIYLKEPFFNYEMESKIIHEKKISDVVSILKMCVNKPITREEYFKKLNDRK